MEKMTKKTVYLKTQDIEIDELYLNPCGHYVLVKPDPIESTTESGVVIVRDERLAKAECQLGTVVATGPTAWKAFRVLEDGNERPGKPWASVGDKVYYSKHSGFFARDPVTEEDYVIMNDDDVQMVIRKNIREQQVYNEH